MTFDIPNIEDAQFYLDLAFSKAKQTAQRKRTSLREGRREKSRQIEHVKVESVANILEHRLSAIVTGFPSFDQLSDFYLDLCSLHFSIDEVRAALGAVDNAAMTIRELGEDYMERIEEAETIDEMNEARKAFYGRAASLVEDIDDELHRLLDAKHEIVEFPLLKDLPTVCITGFPNVGKTTLLKELTGSEPPIEAYNFTTKRLNLGYATIGDDDVQFIDTPGTLARPDKMNDIERKSYVALQHCDLVVYIWDATLQYSIELQERLYDTVQEYEKPIIAYISKSDIAAVGALEEKDATASVKELRELIRQRL